MQRVAVDPVVPDVVLVRRAVRVLEEGGVVVFPTDTLYALAVDPRNRQAVERLFCAKQRDPDVAVPLIASDLFQVEHEVGRLNEIGRRLAKKFWPGPLTLVVEASPGMVEGVRTGRTVAVRVADHPVAWMLTHEFGCAVTGTSANISGQLPADHPDKLSAELLANVDMLVDAGRTRGGLPSTIVDVTGLEPVLVRAGVVSWTRVLESL
jgi:L-threonylcarbamoyladenylate synthase